MGTWYLELKRHNIVLEFCDFYCVISVIRDGKAMVNEDGPLNLDLNDEEKSLVKEFYDICDSVRKNKPKKNIYP